LAYEFRLKIFTAKVLSSQSPQNAPFPLRSLRLCGAFCFLLVSQKMRQRCRHPLRISSSFKRFARGLAAVSSVATVRFRLPGERLALLSLPVVCGLVESSLRLITAATTNNVGLLWRTVNPQINR